MLLSNKCSPVPSSKKKEEGKISLASAKQKTYRLPPIERKSIDGMLKVSDIEASNTLILDEQKEQKVEHTNRVEESIINPSINHSVDSNGEEGEDVDPNVDSKKRSFLKLASMAGLGAVAVSMIPKKAEAYVMGATPTSSVVGVKDASNTRVNPATEETLQTIIAGQGVSKMTIALTASGDVLVPSSGKKIRVYSTRFSLTADLAGVAFRFASGGTDYERYVSPKTGGLYGANNHPNYIEGGINEPVYCVITGTGTVQINVDYLEV